MCWHMCGVCVHYNVRAYMGLHMCECMYICQPIVIYFVLQIILCSKLRLYFSYFNVFFLLLRKCYLRIHDT